MKTLPFILCLLLFSLSAQADIYKCAGDGGAPAFVDGKTKANYRNCQLMMRDNNTQTNPQENRSAAQTATPADFPHVDKQTQNQRDDKRKQILLSELASEQQALSSAKAQGTQTEASLHEKNIELLKKEVSALK